MDDLLSGLMHSQLSDIDLAHFLFGHTHVLATERMQGLGDYGFHLLDYIWVCFWFHSFSLIKSP